MILCTLCRRTAERAEDLKGCKPKYLVKIEDKEVRRDADGLVVDCYAEKQT